MCISTQKKQKLEVPYLLQVQKICTDYYWVIVSTLIQSLASSYFVLRPIVNVHHLGFVATLFDLLVNFDGVLSFYYHRFNYFYCLGLSEFIWRCVNTYWRPIGVLCNNFRVCEIRQSWLVKNRVVQCFYHERRSEDRRYKMAVIVLCCFDYLFGY